MNQAATTAKAKRYIFLRDTGTVAFESDFLLGSLIRASKQNATIVQDRETGIRYDIVPTSPLHRRLQKLS